VFGQPEAVLYARSPATSLLIELRFEMVDLPEKKDNAKPSFRIKREVPRFALVASVEVAVPHTGKRVSGQVTEISRKGCFIETLNALPVGSPIKITISKDNETFRADGAVIYSRKRGGMGVTFDRPAPQQLSILDVWLEKNTSLCFFTPVGSD
jgi:hypothetical protein